MPVVRSDRRYCEPKWLFWALNVGLTLACSCLCALALIYGQRWLAIGVLGLLGGLLTGAKYGARGGFIVAERS